MIDASEPRGRTSASFVQLLAAVLVIAALAGCASGPGGDAGGMIAADGIEAAEQEAKAWDEEAELVSITAIETPTQDTPLETQFEWTGPNPRSVDGDVADGRTTVWVYHFLASFTGDMFHVLVHADGSTETHPSSQEGHMSSAGEATAANVTSAEAASVARSNETIAGLLAEDDAVMHTTVASGSWIIRVYSQTTGTQAQVGINGETGEIEWGWGEMPL